MHVSLIVPAAGLGNRFFQSLERADQKRPCLSKLFYLLDGKPVLFHTLEAFQNTPQIREVVVAISKEMRREIPKWSPKLKLPKIRWILGGKTRAESVWKALKKTSPKSSWVLVHDGARPFISENSIQRIFKNAQGWDGVILARKVVPTLKKVLTEDHRIQGTVDRNSLYEAETPQLVGREVLLKAYRENPRALEATDEASLLEMIGARVRVLPHQDWNPKLTTLSDFLLAKAMIEKNKPSETRVGIGFDTHRLMKGRKLYLGGLRIPSEKGSLGHSDGDALLHAITDAILGVLGAGDIGDWFSDRDARWKNIRSEKLLLKVLKEALRQGWIPYHIDSNIILEKPKLGIWKEKIQKRSEEHTSELQSH